MSKFKISIVKQVIHQDLIDKYENPLENACDLHVGDVFYTNGQERPPALCESAWETIQPFLIKLDNNEKIYQDWMKNPKSAMLSCNDGFRPTSFYVEKLD